MDEEELHNQAFRIIFLDLLKTDSRFRDALSDFLRNENPIFFTVVDTELFKRVRSELFQHLAGIKGYLYNLDDAAARIAKILDDDQLFAFARTLRYAEETSGGHHEYLKELKYKPDGQLDLYGTSKSAAEVYDSSKIKLFSLLNEDERCLLKSLSNDAINLLSNYQPIAVDVFSRIQRLSPEQRKLLENLGLTPNNIFKTFGGNRLRYLSNLPRIRMLKFLHLEANVREDLDDQALDVWNAIVNLGRKEQSDLAKFIKSNMNYLRFMDSDLIALLEKMSSLKPEVLHSFHILSPQDRVFMGSLGEEERNILLGSNRLTHILRIASRFNDEYIDTVLSLKTEHMDTILNTEEPNRIIDFAISPITCWAERLSLPEENFLRRLTEEERSILAKAAGLSGDSLHIISSLRLDQIRQVLRSMKNQNRKLDYKQRVLGYEISRLSEEELVSFLSLTNVEWNVLRRMIPNGYSMSEEGRMVLRAMNGLNEKQIKIVTESSRTGLAVLTRNSHLKGAMIDKLGSLPRDQRELLLNLDLDQRVDIRKGRSNVVGNSEEIGQAMSLLNEEEQLRYDLKDLWVGLNKKELNLATILHGKRPGVVVDVVDEAVGIQTTFRLFEILLNPDSSRDEKIKSIDEELPKILGRVDESPVNRLLGTKLLANVITCARIDPKEGLDIVDRVGELIQDNFHSPKYSFAFYLNLYHRVLLDEVSNDYGVHVKLKMHKYRNELGFLSKNYDLRDKEDLTMIRSLMGHDGIFMNIIRAILLKFTNEGDSNSLNKILRLEDHIPDGVVMRAMKDQLIKDDFYLAKSMLFLKSRSEKSSTKISVFLRNVLEEKQYFDLLMSPVVREPNGFTTLEFALYHDRGDTLPLINRIPNNQIERFFDKNPEILFGTIALNGHMDFLELFDDRLGEGYVRDYVVKNTAKIFKFIMDHLKIIEQPNRSLQSHLASTKIIRYFGGMRSQGNKEIYQEVSSQYVSRCRPFVNPKQLDFIVSWLATDYVSREQLVDALLVPLKDELNGGGGGGCSRTRRKRHLQTLCVDSRDEGEKSLKYSKIGEKLEKISSTAGLGLTVFFVGQHILNGDLEGLKTDTLNLWIMPKIGDNISKGISVVGDQLNSQITKSFAPVLGRLVGNLFAFKGLYDAIGALNKTEDPVDVEILHVNIITNSLFIAADIPGMVAGVATSLGVELGATGALAGPIGAVASVTVLAVSACVQAALQVEKLSEHIDLTVSEKFQFWWDYFLDIKIPESIEREIQVKQVYHKYITDIVNQFEPRYGRIAISLPTISVRKDILRTNSQFMVFEVCGQETKTVNMSLNFDKTASLLEPVDEVRNPRVSKLILRNVGDYSLTCGPVQDEVEITSQRLWHEPRRRECRRSSDTMDPVIGEVREEWDIPENSECPNMVVYRKDNSSSQLFYILQDAEIVVPATANIEMIFQGRDITVRDVVLDSQNLTPTRNRFHFTKELGKCLIHKRGLNFLYTSEDRLSCDLLEEASNVVVVRGLFKDSKNVMTVVGSEGPDRVYVSHAGYVDGRGGNDIIIVRNGGTVKAYPGDSIRGKAVVLLPMRFEEIDSMIVDRRVIVYGERNSRPVVTDRTALLKTLDGYFVTPVKVDKKTHLATDLLVHKTSETFTNLRLLKNCKFKLTKWVSSDRFDIVINEHDHTVFYPDKTDHNYYWESTTGSHLYLFDRSKLNINISRGNGILDFAQLGSVATRTNVTYKPDGSVGFTNEDLQVVLLANYENVTVTFDRMKYYKLVDRGLQRDYCSHLVKIEGRKYMNTTDTFNCFEFDSNRVLFFKTNDDLNLVSDGGSLLLKQYYSTSRDADLSIKLNNKIVKSWVFRARADRPKQLKYYTVREEELEIYHNQPVNLNHVGLIIFDDKSILDFNMKLESETLIVESSTRVLARIRNWTNYQPGREIIFAFKDRLVLNANCIFSFCDPRKIVGEFRDEKSLLARKRGKRELVSNDCLRNNFGLMFLLLSTFLDRKFPLPETDLIEPEEVLADTINVVLEFQRVFETTARKFNLSTDRVDFYQIYIDSIEHAKNGRFFLVRLILQSSVEAVGSGNQDFMRAMNNLFFKHVV